MTGQFLFPYQNREKDNNAAFTSERFQENQQGKRNTLKHDTRRIVWLSLLTFEKHTQWIISYAIIQARFRQFKGNG